MWGRLKGDMVAILSSKIKTSGYQSILEDAYQMWATMAETIRKVAKETLAVSTGKPKVYKQLWCWNEEVQKKIKEKNRRFKELMTCTEEEDRILKKEKYRESKQAAKKEIAEAKDRAFEAFYQKLDTKEGEKYVLSWPKQDLGRRRT